MSRLRKIAEEQQPEQIEDFSAPEGLDTQEPTVEEARDLVGAAQVQVQDLVDQYHALFESLNQLADRYPGLYDELKLAVKFPNEKDAQDIAKMRDAFNDVAGHYQDEAYLGGIIGVKDEG